MLVKTKAIVLSSIKFQEKSLIVKCFTESDGLKSYFVQSAYSNKKANQKIAYFQPLTIIQIEANHKNKGTLEHFKEIKLAHSFHTINTDIVKSTIVGGEFTKLLRIAPIKQSELGYSITEFRNKEKYELDHYEIKSIDIMLCAHDGDLIDFVSNQEVIINLEFSNYLD